MDPRYAQGLRSESNTSITSLEWLGIKNSFTGSHWAHITGLSELHPTGFLCLIATLIIGIVHLTRGPKPTVLPVVNPPGTFELTANRVKKEWLVDARQIIRRGFEKFPGKPFNMIAADVGLTTVLPPEYASEIRNNPSLSFVAFMAHVGIYPLLYGHRRCRDEVKRAGKVIRPVLEKRRREKATMESEGKEALQYNDAIEWFEQMAKSQGTSYDPEVVQLFLSTVAIHTTSDLLTVVMADLARNPEIIEPLREEISSVLRDGGWKKTSLTDMKLLDSVLKESLRLKPIAVGQCFPVYLSVVIR
ncbi:unnamed protein product [Aspergillus oryzae]|uniref:Unnamed protein product n=1 Tax=Aspergillus oryzae TaxID=5062 RepID=A0AAN4YWV9_ASPOZ|nr:unnamed protein product [Aspergillus oryzae]GMG38451.1 unnamed protein product [Aspergillus oryzae]